MIYLLAKSFLSLLLLTVLYFFLSSCRYAKVRTSFDKPIASLYAIQEKLSKMSVKIDASRFVTM